MQTAASGLRLFLELIFGTGHVFVNDHPRLTRIREAERGYPFNPFSHRKKDLPAAGVPKTSPVCFVLRALLGATFFPAPITAQFQPCFSLARVFSVCSSLELGSQMARLSGLQREVLKLYRLCLRASNAKPQPEHFKSVVRRDFRKYQHEIDKKDFATVEFLLRTGHRKLEQYSEQGVKDIH